MLFVSNGRTLLCLTFIQMEKRGTGWRSETNRVEHIPTAGCVENSTQPQRQKGVVVSTSYGAVMQNCFTRCNDYFAWLNIKAGTCFSFRDHFFARK